MDKRTEYQKLLTPEGDITDNRLQDRINILHEEVKTKEEWVMQAICAETYPYIVHLLSDFDLDEDTKCDLINASFVCIFQKFPDYNGELFSEFVSKCVCPVIENYFNRPFSENKIKYATALFLNKQNKTNNF